MVSQGGGEGLQLTSVAGKTDSIRWNMQTYRREYKGTHLLVLAKRLEISRQFSRRR